MGGGLGAAATFPDLERGIPVDPTLKFPGVEAEQGTNRLQGQPGRSPSGMRTGTRECGHLLVVGDGILRTIALSDGAEYRVGSAEDAGIRVEDQAVAPRHAVIRIRGERATIAPEGEACHVLVNFEPVVDRVALAPGDVVLVGSTTLTFHANPRSVWINVVASGTFRQRLAQAVRHAAETGSGLAVGAAHLGCRDDAARARRAIEVLCNGLRTTDIVGWDGGDDLLLLLLEAVGDRDLLCERVMEAVYAVAPRARLGIVRFPADAQDPDALLEMARGAIQPGVFEVAASKRPVVRSIDVGPHRIHVLDPGMRRVFETVERLARTDLPVLVQGETGAGKEMVAFTLHEWSARRKKPLVTINCAAIADTLVENELFGHEAGAFTGAGGAKAGLLEAADGGTVFLDEIGECTPRIQAKLLRVLETRRVSRLGSVRERPIDVRWVAATNRDLGAEVEAGSFRSDLFFRMSTVPITVPPLRDRVVEIPVLARAFLERACARSGRRMPSFSLDATMRMLRYPWPGNVRELRNLMEYLAATVDAPVIEDHMLPPEIGGLAGADSACRMPGFGLPGVQRDFSCRTVVDWEAYPGIYDEIRRLETLRIRQALEAAKSVRVEAARLLDMPLRTFHTKVKEYGIAIPAERAES